MDEQRYQEEFLEREFIGYGFNTPNPQWVDGAKIAVSFIIQYNMGAETNVMDGDETSCGDYIEIPKNTPITGRNENTEMMYEFGGREGVPRLLRLFSKYQFPTTWNIYTRALEKSPYWIKHLLDYGCDLSCGGLRYKDNFNLDPRDEEKQLSEAIDTLQTLTGDKSLPKGWLTDRRSNMTVKLYSQLHADRKLPLLYSSDSCSDDLPYWVPSPTKQGGLLMIPFSYDCSDIRFNTKGSGWASPKDYWLHLKDTFDCLYEEGEEGEPKMMTVLLHPHIIGRAGRLSWFEEFLRYIKTKSGVWVASRSDIAKHWTKTFPYDPKTAFGQTKVEPCDQIDIP